MEKAFHFFKLNNGVKIPSVGLGTWRAGSGLVGKAITDAITAGYRHIDCSQRKDNKKIGQTLKKLFEDGLVKRDDLWITSKLWYTDNAPECVPLAINKTLDELQLDYVNLFLMHWPISMKRSVKFKPENLMKIDIPSTWRAMETLCDDGKAQAIGVTNFSSKKLGDLLEIARVPPAVNQVECHPGWQQPQLHKFCKSTGVHLSTTLPFGSGRNPGQDMLKNPILNLVAEELGKTPAQVCLRWGLQMGHSVLPKSNNEKTIKDNFDVFDWCIPEDLLARFSEIEQVRQIKGDTFVHEKYGSYKTVQELWDGEI